MEARDEMGDCEDMHLEALPKDAAPDDGEYMIEIENIAKPSTATKQAMFTKNEPRKWERRWVRIPNILDLNNGEIWV